MRLHALKRTHGPVLADFPACFFSTGRIVNTATPRGDTSGARAQATAPSSGAAPGSSDTAPCSGSSVASAASEVRAQATASSSGAVPGPSGAVPCSGGSAASTTSGAVPRADATGAHLEKTSSAAPVADSIDEAAPDTGSDGLCLLSDSEGDDDRSPASSLTESSIEDGGGITCRSPMNGEDAIRAVDSLFASVKKADNRQELGKPHTNAGEILPAGVDSLIDSIGDINDQDIFLDVGCGLGNVLVQFALQTLVSKCYGIEMREEVLIHGLQLMDETPSLRDYCGKVGIVCAEASTIQLAFERPYSQATIILAYYRLFEAHVKSHVEEQLGLHDSARVLILGEEVCPRHHASCRSAFCARWHSWKVTSVPVSWTLRADFWIYRRKTS
ncbi:hypothetical protein F444_02138 [Phytophthora nicotianae P1976]|uniref:DOT1 domain-containing protein n=1 Tax=Phytophthora nicotianae P1976 TaxID=1317066 RepID=A0A081AYF6_PHYNI|nr:hypothetical protein F444_02138 [Phytophthora nicotianae P1976]